MPSKAFPIFPLRSNVQDGLLLSGTILLHASTPSVLRGKGFEVAKGTTGIYRVTWNREYGKPVGIGALLMKTAGAATFLASEQWATGENWVDFRIENASGTATDAANTAELAFMINLQLTSGQ